MLVGERERGGEKGDGRADVDEAVVVFVRGGMLSHVELAVGGGGRCGGKVRRGKLELELSLDGAG